MTYYEMSFRISSVWEIFAHSLNRFRMKFILLIIQFLVAFVSL